MLFLIDSSVSIWAILLFAIDTLGNERKYPAEFNKERLKQLLKCATPKYLVLLCVHQQGAVIYSN